MPATWQVLVPAQGCHPACERLAGFEPATFDLASRRSDLLSYTRMEPSPGADPGGTPIPRASGRRSRGHRSGSWTRTSVRLLQGQAGMPSTHPGMSKYARRDSNPQQHGPQPCPSTCLRHERKRAATRCRPGPSAVRRRSRSRARRQSCPLDLSCGRCDSNAQAASSEPARSTGCRHSRVRRQGLEPRSRG